MQLPDLKEKLASGQRTVGQLDIEARRVLVIYLKGRKKASISQAGFRTFK